MKNLPTEIREGEYYELIEDLTPIPKGVYLLHQIEDISLGFRVGQKIFFTIFGNCLSKLRAVPKSRVAMRRTTQSDFVKRYCDLLEIESTVPEHEDQTIFTMCMVDQSLIPVDRRAKLAA